MKRFDAVVVGSGFGASVAACRLAQAGRAVLVLERGRSYPPGSFPRSPRGLAQNLWDPPNGMYGMFDVWAFRRIEALVSSGLGGGSLIYANVLLRKDPAWFVDDTPGEPVRPWPITYTDLEPHYEAAEAMLGAQRYPFHEQPYSSTAKTTAMRSAASQLGLDWQLPNLAITFANVGEPPALSVAIKEKPNLHHATRNTCRLCGECDIGCNDGAKNTLDYNYLSRAADGAPTSACSRRSVASSLSRSLASWSPTSATTLMLHRGRWAKLSPSPLTAWSWGPGPSALLTCCCATAAHSPS